MSVRVSNIFRLAELVSGGEAAIDTYRRASEIYEQSLRAMGKRRARRLNRINYGAARRVSIDQLPKVYHSLVRAE